MSNEQKSFFSDLNDRHERLKKKIHNFRLPLGPFGRFVMSCIYFSIPLIGGYYLMEAVKKQATKNLEELEHRPTSSINHETMEQNQALQKILDQAAKKSKEVL